LFNKLDLFCVVYENSPKQVQNDYIRLNGIGIFSEHVLKFKSGTFTRDVAKEIDLVSRSKPGHKNNTLSLLPQISALHCRIAEFDMLKRN
jgi:hypothetical protein